VLNKNELLDDAELFVRICQQADFARQFVLLLKVTETVAATSDFFQTSQIKSEASDAFMRLTAL
jgi:hypothetical protein